MLEKKGNDGLFFFTIVIVISFLFLFAEQGQARDKQTLFPPLKKERVSRNLRASVDLLAMLSGYVTSCRTLIPKGTSCEHE